MIKWLKKLWRIVAGYDNDLRLMGCRFTELEERLRTTNRNLSALETLIRERTTVSADISASMRDPNVVIVIGRYNKHDYVQLFSLQPEHMTDTVKMLERMEREGEVRRLDAPYSFRQCWERGR